MGLNDNIIHNCTECDYMKKYDYGKKIYFCDHVDRIDDMGKLSVNELPKRSPEWCPNSGHPKVQSIHFRKLKKQTV